MPLVQPYTLLAGNAADWIAGAGAMLLAVLALVYRVRRRGVAPGRYIPSLAWLRAGLYCCAAVIVSWSLGVLQSLLQAPVVTAEHWRDPLWVGCTLGYILVLGIAYLVVWPRGTFTDGRRRHPVLTTAYGLAWGLCHGQVFLCFWALAEWTGLHSFCVATIAWLLLSAYNFAYHQFFWDVHVSPPHNLAAWNQRKILFCHTPNLVLGLLWLAAWGNFGLWLLLQTGCLLASAHRMRFPAWYDDYTAVAGETK